MVDPIFTSISEKLINAEDIVLLPHINVDGDALGALALGLRFEGYEQICGRVDRRGGFLIISVFFPARNR